MDLRIWVMAARLRTLPAAIAPVFVGTALAGWAGDIDWLRFLAALVGAVFIQIGTNLANDYSDARRGADTEDRLGPVRVTAGGLMPPRRVLTGTYVAFGIAVAAGAYLIAGAGWELLLVGIESIAAGVLYTGGPKPYGYSGFGEVAVLVFFGLVATAGSAYVQIERVPAAAWWAAIAVGLLACAILLYDGVCGFCNGSVRWLAARDRAARLHYAPLQGETAAALRARHPGIPTAVETLVFVEDGSRVSMQSAAVFRMLRELPAPWRWIAAAMRR